MLHLKYSYICSSAIRALQNNIKRYLYQEVYFCDVFLLLLILFSLISYRMYRMNNLHYDQLIPLGNKLAMQHVCISLITKREYNIQSSSWYKNVKKGSLYHIRVQFNNND